MNALILAALLVQTPATPAHPATGGYIVEREVEIAANERGPHDGPGQTVAYSFFKNAKLGFVFRKRVLKPGSGMGYHLQKKDEIYYVLSGRGLMNVDGKQFEVGPGTAVLTRPGSSHSLMQAGADDLVVFISYEEDAPARP